MGLQSMQQYAQLVLNSEIKNGEWKGKVCMYNGTYASCVLTKY